MENTVPRINITFAVLCTMILCFSSAQAAPGSKAKAADRPNIVIFLADDLGSADMSCFGSDIQTPHIDSIKKNGVSCTQAYATAPVCAPSRAALLTGRYQHRFGFEDNPGPFRRSPDIEVGLDLKERTIADRLKKLGYTTGIIGKLHDGKDAKFQPPARGFDEFYGFNNGAQRYKNVDSSETPMMRGTKPEKHGQGYLTDTFGREAAAFVDRHKDEAFFLYVSFNAPHGPLTATNRYLNKYASIKDIQRRTYAAMVDAMDVAIGKVMNKLRQHNIEDNTMVMFLSDHGGVTGNKGHWASNGSLRAGKGTMFEGGLRTPLFVQWKSKLPTGGVVEHPVTTMDLLPTAVAAAGGTIDPTWKLDGVNLLPHLRGETKSRPYQTIYWRMNEMWAIRDGDWKVFKDRGTAPLQLFNLANDPSEKQNVAGQHADKLKQLRSKYDAWSNSVERPRFGWWQGVGPRVDAQSPRKQVKPKPPVASGLRMHRIFSDHMILQQNTSNAIWGWIKPGETVTVKASWGATATAKANNDGKWTAFLKTPGHGTGHTLSINNKTIKNVAIGEVWLCAGQSNMGWSMGNSFGAEEEAKNAHAPNLRIFKSQREHWHEPLDISRDLLAKWKPCTPESAVDTSAVSYYFAKTVQAELGIPVGIIVQAYAGTPIEGWMPKEVQGDDPRIKAGIDSMDQLSRRQSKDEYLKKFETELAEYQKKIAAGETMKNKARALSPPIMTRPANLGHQYPSHIFNGMIHPIRPYGIRGAIWYQGERNSKNPAQAANYRVQLARLIDYYRNSWHELSGGNVADNFPFFFTQLPSWTAHQTKPAEGPEAPWAINREMMRLVTDEVPNTGMAVSIDTGDAVELHPKNKQPIGLRHAYLALANVYGKEITASGPHYQSHLVKGNAITLIFGSTGSGLVPARPGKLDAFALAGKNKQWHWANATIEGNTVVVSSPQVPQPVAVRYAWAMNPSKRDLLYNKEGFPASPFRTDDWPLVDREYSARETSYEKPAKPDGYVAKDWARPVMNFKSSSHSATPGAPSAKPNILFIFSDDHALRAIGAYGSGLNKTPNIDRIANEGALFTRSYNTNSICCPSRASILTGKHSHKNGVTGNGSKWNSNQFVFTRALSRTGYSTALIGKWHIKGLPAAGEFDHFQILSGGGGQGHYYNPEFVNMDGSTEHATGYSTDIITNKSINWMTKQRAAGKPFMLMCNFKAPHIHRIPPPRHMNNYDDVTLPIPSTFFDDFKNRSPYAGKCWMKLAGMQEPILNITPRAGRYDINERKFEFLKRMTPDQRDAFHRSYDPDNDAYRRDRAAGKLNGDDLSRYKYQRFIKDYIRCVDAIDDNVGRLLKWLEDNNLADNTVVVYSSDQGFFTGEHGWNDKRWMYEETVSMPLMMRWPGHIKPGTRVNAMVQNIDYAPTFLDIAGAKTPDEVQGRSLLPLFSGNTPSDWRKAIYYHYYDDGSYNLPRFEGVRDARYKLVNYYFPKQEWELFDLEKDPNEIRSVYGDPAYAEVQKKLNQDLQRLRKQYDLPPLNLKPRH